MHASAVNCLIAAVAINFASADPGSGSVSLLDDLENLNVFETSICCARCADLIDSSNEIWPTAACELLPSVPLDPCRVNFDEMNLTSPASQDYRIFSLGGLRNGQGHLLLQTPLTGPKLDVIYEDVNQLKQMHSFDFKACRLETEPEYAYEHVRKWLAANRAADVGDPSKNYKILLGAYEVCDRPRCELTIVKRVIEHFDE
ncbi:hypothetical protein TKK_0005282 [Trichogramma kaykai]|uniref:Uncharacterized protein n=1 Tax=Trichogramma kaykai TaxID=54128 RepID=A0ABD2XI45_9HYME